MGTLTFAELRDADTSMGSSIASTVQQMSMSFGVAIASLLAVMFVGTRQPGDTGMILGIHRTLLTLGLLTVGSAAIFLQLKRGDGATLSHHETVEA